METNMEESSKARTSYKKVKLLYTVCIFLNHLAFGMVQNTMWAPLDDFTHIYQASVNALTYLGTFSSLGYLIGSLSGFLYKWTNRQLVLSFLVILIGITMALMPYYHYVPLLYGAMTLNGVGSGSWDSSNNVWLVEMWPERQASVVQASQFMYGLGTVLGPLLIASYVHNDDDNSTSNSTLTPQERQRQLKMPFAVIGSAQIVVPLTFLILFFVKRYQKLESAPQAKADVELSEDTVGNLVSNSNRKVKLCLVAICVATYDASEIAYFYYSTTMWRNFDHPLDAENATHVLVVLSAAYTAGRLITSFVALRIKPDYITTYHYVIIVLGLLVVFFGQKHQTVIYLGTAVLGYGFSAMWPSILAVTERHLKLSDRVGSLLFFAAGLVSIFTPFLIGSYLEHQPWVLFLFEACYLGVSMSAFVILRLFFLKA